MPKKDQNKIRNKLAAKAARRKKKKQLRKQKAKRKSIESNKTKNMVAQLKQQSQPTFDKNAWFKQKPDDQAYGVSNNTNVNKEKPKVFDKGAWKPDLCAVDPAKEGEDWTVVQIVEVGDTNQTFDKAAWHPK